MNSAEASYYLQIFKYILKNFVNFVSHNLYHKSIMKESYFVQYEQE